jgi:hypothetical protein
VGRAASSRHDRERTVRVDLVEVAAPARSIEVDRSYFNEADVVTAAVAYSSGRLATARFWDSRAFIDSAAFQPDRGTDSGRR